MWFRLGLGEGAQGTTGEIESQMVCLKGVGLGRARTIAVVRPAASWSTMPSEKQRPQ